MKRRKVPTNRKKKRMKKLKSAPKSNRKRKRRKLPKIIKNKNKNRQKKRGIKQTATISLKSHLGKNLLLQNQQYLSIIITAHNEESTIKQLLDSAMQLKPKEIIIIENGSTDRTLEICKMYPVRCFSYPFRLGHDVGRALGAQEAMGDVLLFLDGDIAFKPSTLLPFVKACYDGADIALNNLDPFYKNASTIEYVSMAKNYLNRLMLRHDLGFCSLTAIPHAITKNAALTIGIENLAVPPKAHAIALYLGLKVEKASTVNVFRSNKFRSYHNEVGRMILGDHIEAIRWLQERTSERVKFADPYRIRSYSKVRIHVH